MKKMPAFFSNIPSPSSLEKAEKQKRIKLMEGANKGRQANVVGEEVGGLRIVPRTGQKPFKVVATEGDLRTASDKRSVFWGRDRKHKVIQEGVAAPKSQLATPQDPSSGEESFSSGDGGSHSKGEMKTRVFTSKDLHAFMPHSDEQKALVEGIDLAKVKPHGEGWTGEWAVSGFGKNKSGSGVVFKGRMPESQIDEVGYGKHLEMLTTAQREGLYHNIANHMGLGQYVPTTAVLHDKTPGADGVSRDHGPQGNHYSVMEKVPGAMHYNGSEKQDSTLRGLHKSGELHKLGIMNAILGNTDRHSGNWMMSPKGLHLIDHGLTFDYHNREREFVHPNYLGAGLRAAGEKEWSPNPLHENAKNWLLGLSESKMKSFLKDHKVHSDFKKPIISGLQIAQRLVKEDPKINVNKLLEMISSEVRRFGK